MLSSISQHRLVRRQAARCDVMMHLAVDLLKKMLVKDPKGRITSAEALEHEWFGSTSATLNVPLKFIRDQLAKYQAE